MNTNHDELERLLGDELNDRAGDIGGARLNLSDVRGRATSIRRRRRIAGGVGAAAVLAIVVPLAITAGSIDRTSKPDPAPPVPGPTEVARTTLTLDGIPRGDAPGIEYFTADGVVLPDEGLQPLDQSYQALVPREEGWLALSPGKDFLEELDEGFGGGTALGLNQVLVTDPERTHVAYSTMDPDAGQQALVTFDASQPDDGMNWLFPRSPLVQPVDYLGENTLLYQATRPNGRLEAIGIAHADGTTTELEGRYVEAISANPEAGLVAVQTRTNDDASGCFGVVDPSVSAAETVWETCDHSLGGFSPDGRYLLASDPYQSGLGPASLSVLDARTGALVATFQQDRASQIALMGVAWESDNTIIGIASEGATSTILRFGVDGTLGETADRVDGDPLADQAYYLGQDRRRGY